jgi:regulator of nonsense transcripts 1
MVPGSVYDRSGGNQPPNNNSMNTYIPRATANVGDPYSRLHDPIGYIAPERAQAALSAMPVPLGVFMNMTHVPPRFHGQQQQGTHGLSKSNQRPKDNARSGPRAGKTASKGSSSLFTQSLSQNTQDVSTQPFSQGGMALTQGMSQVK